MTQRRTVLKAGASAFGTIGLAGMGLTWPLSSAAEAARSLYGMRPMYSAKVQQNRSSFDPVAAVSPAPDESVRALRRLAFGYLPQDLQDFLALGDNFDQRLENYVNDQLNGYQPGYPPSNDPQLSAVLNDPLSEFETLDASLEKLYQERFLPGYEEPGSYFALVETQVLAVLRAVYSRWQLAEILADFWHTHFSVEGWRFEIASIFVHYDRDVIRSNMLGNFRQMLESVTKSTEMLRYLDNASNTKYGPNENYARELQELHTLGAIHSHGFTAEQDIPMASPMPGSSTTLPNGLKAGYSEQDVGQVTLSLTGWTFSNEWTDGLDTGTYIFHDDWHDYSAKRVLGIDISSSGEAETHQVLDLLAMHPNTARYICGKLCARLIDDNPPESIVEKAAAVFNDQWQAPDQLKQVIKTIILSDEFKDAAHWGGKVKRPFEFVTGAVRSCGGFTSKFGRPDPFGDWHANVIKGKDFKFSQDIYWRLGDTGSMPFTWATPDGFPDNKQSWLGGSPLIIGWKVLNEIFMNWYPNDTENLLDWYHFFPVDTVAVTKNALPPDQRSARNIVDFWVNRILGYDIERANTAQLDATVRARLIAFMQQDASDQDLVLDLDANTWDDEAWKAFVPERVQTLVASIAMLPDNLLR